MKLVLLMVVVLFGVWLWRSRREARVRVKRKSSQTSQTPTETVRCSHCSVHVALTEVLKGKKGDYCCLDHRQRAEQ
jgi:uncharacterized protein